MSGPFKHSGRQASLTMQARFFGFLVVIAFSVTAVYATTIDTEVVYNAPSFFQTGAGSSFTVNDGGSIVIQAPQWETIIMQQATGTSTININSGGSMDFSNASGKGVSLWIGNANANAFGVINVNGGFLGGEPLTNIVFGRSGAHGEVNISTGSVLFGAAPVFSRGFINFTTPGVGSEASLRVIGKDEAYFQSLYASNNLRFQGTNTGEFSDYFDVQGDTLVIVPEASTALLLGSGLAGLLSCRRRRRSSATCD